MLKKKKILLVTFGWGDENHSIYKFSEQADISAHNPNAAAKDLSHAIKTSLSKQDDIVFDFNSHKPEYDIIIVDSQCPHNFWMVALVYSAKIMLINILCKPNLVPRGRLHHHGNTLITYDDTDSWDDLATLMHIPPRKKPVKEKDCVLQGVPH